MENFNGRKLLILAGAGVHVKVVRAAKEMGIYTIVADYLTDSPAKAIADEAWLVDIKDVDTLEKKCKEEHVDAVLAFCIDPAQKPYQELCERLGVPCFANKVQFDIMTNKNKFKAFCRAHGVDVIPEYTINDIESGTVEYPLLIKPSDSRGSRGQTICHTAGDVHNAIETAKSESGDGRVIIEKYVGDLQDAAFAYIVIDGTPYLMKIADRTLGTEEDGMRTQAMLTFLPSASTSMYRQFVEPVVIKMIQALGIKYGPVFLQGFIDKAKKKVYYYDPGLRFPGGDYDIILKEATGFDTVKSLILFALTGDTKSAVGNPVDACLLNGKTGALITASVKPGYMKTVMGLDRIKENKYTVYARQIIPEGSVIPHSNDIKQRIIEIGVLLPERDLIYDYIRYFFDTYHALNDKNEEMMISSLLRWHE